MKRARGLRGAALALGWAGAAAALDGEPVSVAPCDDFRSSAANLAEPWEANTRVFANGAVRVALLDTLEPAAAAFHLLVLSPPYDIVGDRTCQVLSMPGGFGFNRIEFDSLFAEYDPAVGLSFTVVVGMLPEVTEMPFVVEFTLNQATGDLRGILFPSS